MSPHAIYFVWLSADGTTHALCACGWFGPDRHDDRTALVDGDRHLAAEQAKP